LRKQVAELRALREKLVQERQALTAKLTDTMAKLDAAQKGAAANAPYVVGVVVTKDGLLMDHQKSDWKRVEERLLNHAAGMQPSDPPPVLQLVLSGDLSIEERMKARRQAEVIVGKNAKLSFRDFASGGKEAGN
jgi:hypothetical protein